MKRYLQIDTKRNFSIAAVWINGGSNMDKIGKRGLNHILCSLLVRGCKGYDNLALSDFIESFGAELNHEVFEDGILISIKSLDSYFNEIFPILDLILNEPILSEKQFKIVKKCTINSLKKERENSFNICFENWRKNVYKNHPYAFNSIGNEKDITNINYQDILNEYKKFKSRKKFLISNSLIIKQDCMEVQDIECASEEFLYSNFHKNKEKRFASFFTESNQIIMMLGNQTCSRKSKDFLPLKVLESHLSFGMSSLLFKLFREQNGITYDLGVLNSIKRENAPFLIYLSVSNKNGILAFKLLSKMWHELLFSTISEEEISLAKEKLKGSFLISNQSLDNIFHRKIQLIGYEMSPSADDDFFSEIDTVSSKKIKEIANKYLSNPYLSITGKKGKCLEIKDKWIYDF